ncbi:MAG: hypothetical protein ACE1Z4_11050 [Gammaproteobacteria bacterium]
MTTDLKVTGPLNGEGLYMPSAEQSKALDAAELGSIGFASFVNRNLPNAVDYIGQSDTDPNFLAALTLCRAYVQGLRAAAGDS